MTLPAWSVRALEELDTSDRHANALAGALTPEQLNWKPAPDQWSVGQCLDHLYLGNQVYCLRWPRRLTVDRPRRCRRSRLGWLGRWFVRTQIDPSTQRRRGRAPGKITPAPRVDPSVLDRFVRSNDAARDLVRRASAYDVNRIRFVNPFVPLVRFTVGTGLEVVWRHQRRHLLQAERVTQSSGFPR